MPFVDAADMTGTGRNERPIQYTTNVPQGVTGVCLEGKFAMDLSERILKPPGDIVDCYFSALSRQTTKPGRIECYIEVCSLRYARSPRP
jgi:hypothetical protein